MEAPTGGGFIFYGGADWGRGECFFTVRILKSIRISKIIMLHNPIGRNNQLL